MKSLGKVGVGVKVVGGEVGVWDTKGLVAVAELVEAPGPFANSP
ncbi:hypothetical protein [Paenarthrobacter nicotinovorans]